MPVKKDLDIVTFLRSSTEVGGDYYDFIETPEGDFIGIRHKMFLSHSYDHRVVDGALGGQFVRRVADYLEQFDINRNF